MKKEFSTLADALVHSCNPVAIKFSDRNKWKGQIGKVGLFCKFKDMKSCYRSWLMLMCTYLRKYNINTIRDIIERYAPPNVDNNHTENYIKFCSENVKSYMFDNYNIELIKPDIVPLYSLLLYDELFRQMAKFETGHTFSDLELKEFASDSDVYYDRKHFQNLICIHVKDYIDDYILNL